MGATGLPLGTREPEAPDPQAALSSALSPRWETSVGAAGCGVGLCEEAASSEQPGNGSGLPRARVRWEGAGCAQVHVTLKQKTTFCLATGRRASGNAARGEPSAVLRLRVSVSRTLPLETPVSSAPCRSSRRTYRVGHVPHDMRPKAEGSQGWLGSSPRSSDTPRFSTLLPASSGLLGAQTRRHGHEPGVPLSLCSQLKTEAGTHDGRGRGAGCLQRSQRSSWRPSATGQGRHPGTWKQPPFGEGSVSLVQLPWEEEPAGPGLRF